MLSLAEETAGMAWVGCGKEGVVSVFLGGTDTVAKVLRCGSGLQERHSEVC